MLTEYNFQGEIKTAMLKKINFKPKIESDVCNFMNLISCWICIKDKCTETLTDTEVKQINLDNQLGFTF